MQNVREARLPPWPLSIAGGSGQFCSTKMDLGPAPSGAETNHAEFSSRPKTELFSAAVTFTPRTTNGRLHYQDASFALTRLTGSVIRVDSLTIAGRAVFRREASPRGSGGAFHGNTLNDGRIAGRREDFTKGLTMEAICERHTISRTALERNRPEE